jgi:plasmid stabilization system protein ParE
MIVNIRESFQDRFLRQIEYIAFDNPEAARKFSYGVLKAIQKLPDTSFTCRKSIYFDSDAIRDLIYKGYTIVFENTETSIEVFGFVKNQKGPINQ